MNTTKLNDWLQIAAAAGVIVGLVLVAYEIRISNRIGIEQANAAMLDRWDVVLEAGTSPQIADLFVRAHEGDELSRAEVFMLNNFLDQYLNTLSYELQLAENEIIKVSPEAYQGVIQLYGGNQYFRRRWEAVRYTYDDTIVPIVDSALAAPEQRDIIAYLDYIRGATDRLD